MENSYPKLEHHPAIESAPRDARVQLRHTGISGSHLEGSTT